MRGVHIKQSTVILLHGITRSSRMMLKIEEALLADDYDVVNLDYPSTSMPIEDLAEWVYEKIKPYCDNEKPLHFVGHSMGGILIRLIIQKHRPANLSRVVMIGVPNHGSGVAAFMQRFWFYKKWFGPAGQQIGSNHTGIHHDLVPADYACGIIAGDRSSDPWFSWFLFKGPDDGRVSVEAAKLEGMTDYVVIHATHAGLPKDKKCIAYVRDFLSDGRFKAL